MERCAPWRVPPCPLFPLWCCSLQLCEPWSGHSHEPLPSSSHLISSHHPILPSRTACQVVESRCRALQSSLSLPLLPSAAPLRPPSSPTGGPSRAPAPSTALLLPLPPLPDKHGLRHASRAGGGATSSPPLPLPALQQHKGSATERLQACLVRERGRGRGRGRGCRRRDRERKT